MEAQAKQHSKPLIVSGLAGSSSLYFVSKHCSSALICLPSHFNLDEAAGAISTFSPNTRILRFPSFISSYENFRESPETNFERLQTLYELSDRPISNSHPTFILTNSVALSQKVLNKKELQKLKIKISKSQTIERDELIHSLKAVGYLQDELAQDAGFFSVRGFLLDVFPPYSENPIRIEFFGDEVVSIREFDSETQRSLNEIGDLEILPCREIHLSKSNYPQVKQELKDLGDSLGIAKEDREQLLWQIENQREVVQTRLLLPAFSSELTGLVGYLPKDLPVASVDLEQSLSEFESAYAREASEYSEQKKLAYSPDHLHENPKNFLQAATIKIDQRLTASGTSYQVLTHEELRQSLVQAKNFKPLRDLILQLRDEGQEIHLVFKNEKKMEALKDSLDEAAQLVQWDFGEIFSSFSSNTFKRAFLNEKDIFGTKRKRPLSNQNVSAAEFLREFSDLKEGDYIVHEVHGVGCFKGLIKLKLAQVESEFVLIEYLDEDKLYLPIYRIDQISRYLSGDGVAEPRLDRLGSQNFQKKRTKAREDILKIAHELMEVAAKRKTEVLDRQRVDEETYQKFCESFPFLLTPDQEKAVQEIHKDLESNHPMDRLICGDVGFGKTEVALRAAFLRVLQGKQVAVLAPTTLLVEQHFRNFFKRIHPFGMKIERMSRFVSSSEQKKISERIKSGDIQLIVGTHRLLQSDITFKDLGMLIIDEEQRFGVKHKEKIKKLRSHLDVLTLSATPIPRTLQMSIVGIRDLSLIVSPPDNREAVETRVASFDPHLLHDAAKRELERGGQILFVHNRVKSIQSVYEKLVDAFPKCKIAIGHGQMPEDELEDIMIGFVEHRYDVLLATSIIENGIDIPNANTLFVDRADQFGLADLYQLRGRVGRGNRRAFAYFLIHEGKPITMEASKRLQVIQSCTELGSGFRVATHDLEIRGSGNLLGEAQSGVISEIGLELYNQMLHETLSELRNDSRQKIRLPELNSSYSAYLPETYIPDIPVRISSYRRLNQIDSLQELLNFEDEFLDRFGLYPPEVDNLCQLTRIKLMAAGLRAKSVDVSPGKLGLEFDENSVLEPDQVIRILNKQTTLDPKGKLIFQFESAASDSKLIQNTKFERPELYDFDICRAFLQKLLKRAGIESL